VTGVAGGSDVLLVREAGKEEKKVKSEENILVNVRVLLACDK